MSSHRCTMLKFILFSIFVVQESLTYSSYDYDYEFQDETGPDLSCEGKDPKCSITVEYTKKQDNFIPTLHPLVLNIGNETIVEAENKPLTLDKSDQVKFKCLGRDNGLIDRKGEFIGSRGSMGHRNYEKFTCKCGSIFESSNNAYDTNDVHCRYPHKADIILFDEVYRLHTWGKFDFYQHRSIFNLYRVHVSIDGPSHSNIIIYYSKEDCRTAYVYNTMRKSHTERNANIKMNISNIRVDHGCPMQDLNTYYNENSQLLSFQQQLSSEQTYLKPKTEYVFVPVYLTPANSLPKPFGQLVTDINMNTAPQWKTISDGNWAITQDHVNNKLARLHNLQVMTGLHGRLSFGNVDHGDSVELYLSHKSKEIEIPLYFVKIATEPGPADFFYKPAGVVLVTVNNPYLTLSTGATYAKKVCTNPSTDGEGTPTWNWQHDNTNAIPAGYSFLCTIPDFLKRSEFPIADTELIYHDDTLVYRQPLKSVTVQMPYYHFNKNNY